MLRRIEVAHAEGEVHRVEIFECRRKKRQVPDQEYREAFTKKTGAEVVKLEVQPFARGSHPHMDNFLDCVRSRQEPNLPAKLGYQAMAAIGMGVQAYRQSEVLFFDRRKERVTNKLSV